MQPELRQQTTELDRDLGQLRDIDLLPSGEWVGVFRTPSGQVVRIGDVWFPAPRDVAYPVVRFVTEDSFVLADTRIDEVRDNAWVYDRHGRMLAKFCAGDGIEDVLGRDGRIVFTYFDEGVFGDVPPSQEGVCVFDANGEPVLRYHTDLGASAVEIADCYSACWGEGLQLWFAAYTGFPLVSLDLATKAQEVTKLPEALDGATGLSTNGSSFFFFSPYKDKNAIIEWAPGMRPAFRGLHQGPLRGLPGGRFLAVGDFGFSVVCPGSGGSVGE